MKMNKHNLMLSCLMIIINKNMDMNLLMKKNKLILMKKWRKRKMIWMKIMIWFWVWQKIKRWNLGHQELKIWDNILILILFMKILMMKLKLVGAEVNLNHLLRLIQAKNVRVIKFQKISNKKINFLPFRKWSKLGNKIVMGLQE